MVRPKVRPPKPHIAPQNQHQNQMSAGVRLSTPSRSSVWIAANSQGISSQEKMPPVSQKISHDQRLMRLYGT
jgi:hypothetical protein